MKAKKLPFDTYWHSGDDALMWRWYEELERLGPENVRIRAIQQGGGSAGSIMGLGKELQVTKGFVEDWLMYRDAQRSRQASSQFIIATTVSAVAAIAASISAWPVIRGWFGTWR